MICRSPLIVVMLFVIAAHTVLALEIATRIDASETESPVSAQMTRVSYRPITSVDNKRFLRQETTFEKKLGVNDVHAVHAEERSALGKAKILGRDLLWFMSILGRFLIPRIGRRGP
uniref:Secreted RxLR effector protein 2 n=1 Tax=Plasmopara viticola TaxID=143451 RepID=RLR2_PLAVT|nr:RecName: Full=Secreted RxLR effector protein 2; Flags: Precursor [Plasmopara viticola]ANC73367.1 secreted RxLR effector peptide protein 2 [Plasmopara viticola]